MLHQDYLVRMFMILAAAMRENVFRSADKEDPEAKAELLENTLINATEVDGTLLLKMDPDTMVSMLQISNTDPLLIQYVARTLLLESQYLEEAQQTTRATLRKNQALTLARAYGFPLSLEDLTSEALEQFFRETMEQVK
jgi:hypothetical protein